MKKHRDDRNKGLARSRAFTEVFDGSQETAATTNVPKNSRKRLSLSRVQDLCHIAGEIVGLLDQKTHSEAEARFVANFVKGAVYHWQPEDERE